MDYKQRRGSTGSNDSLGSEKMPDQSEGSPAAYVAGRYERRSRYSMNYQSYEATRIQPAEQTRRMLDYMFPGYQKRDPRNWYEKMTQTDLEGSDVYGLIGTELIEAEPIYDTRFSSLKMDDDDDESPEEQEMLNVTRKAHRPSVVTKGWEGPPIKMKGKSSQEGFHLQVDDQYHQPQTILVPREVIESQTLKMDVVPDEQGIPKVIIYLGAKQDGDEEDDSPDETVVIYDGRADFDEGSEDNVSPNQSVEKVEPEPPPQLEEEHPKMKKQLKFGEPSLEEGLDSLVKVRDSLDIVANVPLMPDEETPVIMEDLKEPSSNDTVGVPAVTSARNSRLIEPIKSTGSHLDVWESIIPDLESQPQVTEEPEQQMEPEPEPEPELVPEPPKEEIPSPSPEPSPPELTPSEHTISPDPSTPSPTEPESEPPSASPTPEPEKELETFKPVPPMLKPVPPPEPVEVPEPKPEPKPLPKPEPIIVPLPVPVKKPEPEPKPKPEPKPEPPKVEEPRTIKKSSPSSHTSDPADKIFAPLDNYPQNMDEDQEGPVHSEEREPPLQESPETDHPLKLTDDYPSRYSTSSSPSTRSTSKTPTPVPGREPSEVSNWLEDNILTNARNATGREKDRKAPQKGKKLSTVEEAEEDSPLKVLDDHPSSSHSRSPPDSGSPTKSKRASSDVSNWLEANVLTDAKMKANELKPQPPAKKKSPQFADDANELKPPPPAKKKSPQFADDDEQPPPAKIATFSPQKQEPPEPVGPDESTLNGWLDNTILKPAEEKARPANDQAVDKWLDDQIIKPAAKTRATDEKMKQAPAKTGVPDNRNSQEGEVSSETVDNWIEDEIIRKADPKASGKGIPPPRPGQEDPTRERTSLDEQVEEWVAEEIIQPAQVDNWVDKKVLQPTIPKTAPTKVENPEDKHTLFEPSEMWMPQPAQPRESVDDMKVDSWVSEEIITPAEDKRQKVAPIAQPRAQHDADRTQEDSSEDVSPAQVTSWVDNEIILPAVSSSGIQDKISKPSQPEEKPKITIKPKSKPAQHYAHDEPSLAQLPSAMEKPEEEVEKPKEEVEKPEEDQDKNLADREETFHWLDKSQEFNPFRPHFDSPDEDWVKDEVPRAPSERPDQSPVQIAKEDEKEIPRETVATSDQEISTESAAKPDTSVTPLISLMPPPQQKSVQSMKDRSPETSMGSFRAKALKQQEPEDSSQPYISPLLDSGKRQDEMRRSSLLAKKAIENDNYLIRDDEEDYVKKEKPRYSEEDPSKKRKAREDDEDYGRGSKFRDDEDDYRKSRAGKPQKAVSPDKRPSLLEKVFPQCFKRRRSSSVDRPSYESWDQRRSSPPPIQPRQLPEAQKEQLLEESPVPTQSHPTRKEEIKPTQPPIPTPWSASDGTVGEPSVRNLPPAQKEQREQALEQFSTTLTPIQEQPSELVLTQVSPRSPPIPEPQQQIFDPSAITRPTTQEKSPHKAGEIEDFPEAIETRGYPIFPDYEAAQQGRHDMTDKSPSERQIPLPPRRGFPLFPDYQEIVSPKEPQAKQQGPSTAAPSASGVGRSNVGGDDKRKGDSQHEPEFSQAKLVSSQPSTESKSDYQERPWPSKASSYIPSDRSEAGIAQLPKLPSKEPTKVKLDTDHPKKPDENLKSTQTSRHEAQHSPKKDEDSKQPDPPGHGIPLFSDYGAKGHLQDTKSHDVYYAPVQTGFSQPQQKMATTFYPSNAMQATASGPFAPEKQERMPALIQHPYSSSETPLVDIMDNLARSQHGQAPSMPQSQEQPDPSMPALRQHTYSAKPMPVVDLMNNLGRSQQSLAPLRPISGTEQPRKYYDGMPAQQPGVISQQHPQEKGQPGMLGQQQPRPMGQQQAGVIGQQQPRMFGQQQPGLMRQQQPGMMGQPQPGIMVQTQPGMMGQQQPRPTALQQPRMMGQQQPEMVSPHHPGVGPHPQAATKRLSQQTQPHQRPIAPGQGIPRFPDYGDDSPQQPPMMTGDHRQELSTPASKPKIVTAADKKAEIERQMLPITQQMENLKKQMYELTPQKRPMRTGPEYRYRHLPTSLEIYTELEKRTMAATKSDREAVMTMRRKQQYEDNARRKIQRAIERSKQTS